MGGKSDKQSSSSISHFPKLSTDIDRYQHLSSRSRPTRHARAIFGAVIAENLVRQSEIPP
jgi:hypothetical protein